jgi:hypothetical protein
MLCTGARDANLGYYRGRVSLPWHCCSFSCRIATRSLAIKLGILVLIALQAVGIHVPEEGTGLGDGGRSDGGQAVPVICPVSHGCDVHATCVPGVRPGRALAGNSTGGGVYHCVCDTGWVGTGLECSNVDECAAGRSRIRTVRRAAWEGPCKANQICQDTEGSFSCECEVGYESGSDGDCLDVNECAAGTHNCLEGALCQNTPGGFRCSCINGFNGDG